MRFATDAVIYRSVRKLIYLIVSTHSFISESDFYQLVICAISHFRKSGNNVNLNPEINPEMKDPTKYQDAWITIF